MLSGEDESDKYSPVLSENQLQSVVDDTLIEFMDRVSQLRAGGDASPIVSSEVLQRLIDFLSYKAGKAFNLQRVMSPNGTELTAIAVGLQESITARLKQLGIDEQADNYSDVLSEFIVRLRQVKERAVVAERSSGDVEAAAPFFKERVAGISNRLAAVASAEKMEQLETGKDVQQGIKMEQYDHDVLAPVAKDITELQQLIHSKKAVSVAEQSLVSTWLFTLNGMDAKLSRIRDDFANHYHRRQPVERAMRQAKSLDELAAAALQHTEFMDWYGSFANAEQGKAQQAVDFAKQVETSVKKYGATWKESTKDIGFYSILTTAAGWGFLPVFLIRVREVAEEMVRTQKKSEAQQFLENHFSEGHAPSSIRELLDVLQNEYYSGFVIDVKGKSVSLADIAAVVQRLRGEILRTEKAPDSGISAFLYTEIGFDAYGIVDTANRLLRQMVEPESQVKKADKGTSALGNLLSNPLGWLRGKERSNGQTEEFLLYQDVFITIGRRDDQKFVIPENVSNSVSREHAALFWFKGEFVIRVLSNNGLMLDGYNFDRGSIVKIDTMQDHDLELGGVRVKMQFIGDSSSKKVRLSLATK